MADPGHLEEGLDSASPWYLWGPYLRERAWGTVREDYSADGDAWSYFPHDHARSRAYRWNEDGMAGLSDVFARLCLGLALWNGRDPILKERMFGLTNSEGNHGEDVKDYWWYLDALPASAWLRWRYHYPQAEFPYERPASRRTRRRAKLEPEYELLDTGRVRRRRYWIVEVALRQGGPDRHPDADHGQERGPGGRHAPRAADDVVPQHVVVGRRRAASRRSSPTRRRPRSSPRTRSSGDYALDVGAGPGGGAPELLFCENETNARAALRHADRPRRARRTASTTTSCTARTRSIPSGAGTKAAAWYRSTRGSRGRRPRSGCGCGRPASTVAR